jgi:hypothetical protein
VKEWRWTDAELQDFGDRREGSSPVTAR